MKIKNVLLTAGGFLLLALGAVGVFVPILPTTPFVLAAAACFAGNKKILNRLLKSPLFSDYIINYKERRGLKKSTVAVSLSFLWATLTLSALLVDARWFYVLAPAIALAVTAHIIVMAIPKNKAPKKQALAANEEIKEG